MCLKPIRHRDGQHLQGMAECLPHKFDAIQRADRRQDVTGVGTLVALWLEQSALADSLQEQVQEQSLGTALDQPATELAQDGVIETGILQLETERVLPNHARAYGIRCLAVGQILDKLERGDQCLSPRALGWLAAFREQVRELVVSDEGLQLVSHAHVRVPGREGRTGET